MDVARAGPRSARVRLRPEPPVRRRSAPRHRHRRREWHAGRRACVGRGDLCRRRADERQVGDDRDAGRLFGHAHASRLDRRDEGRERRRGEPGRNGRAEWDARARRALRVHGRSRDREPTGIPRPALVPARAATARAGAASAASSCASGPRGPGDDRRPAACADDARPPERGRRAGSSARDGGDGARGDDPRAAARACGGDRGRRAGARSGVRHRSAREGGARAGARPDPGGPAAGGERRQPRPRVRPDGRRDAAGRSDRPGRRGSDRHAAGPRRRVARACAGRSAGAHAGRGGAGRRVRAAPAVTGAVRPRRGRIGPARIAAARIAAARACRRSDGGDRTDTGKRCAASGAYPSPRTTEVDPCRSAADAASRRARRSACVTPSRPLAPCDACLARLRGRCEGRSYDL